MRRQPRGWWLMGLSLCMALATGCVSAEASRQAYLEAHPELDPALRELIRQGRVREGMSMEQVEASLGPPDSRRRFSGEDPPLEVWTYPGVLVRRKITRTLTDQDYRVRLLFRSGVLESIQDL